jgi:hypothetical protein
VVAAFGGDTLAQARALRDHLRTGGQPATQQPTMRLYDGEAQYFASGFKTYVYEGKDVYYRTMHVWGCGLWSWMFRLLFLPYNLLRRGVASAQGAHKWRVAGGGQLCLTNNRLVLNAGTDFREFGHANIAQVDLREKGVFVAYYAGVSMILDVGAYNPIFLVLLRFFAFGDRNANV